MIVLGINDGHNASAAIIQNGKLVAALQEERLTRIKNQPGFPKRAIETILKMRNLVPSDIDYVAMGGFETAFPGEEKNLRAYKASGTWSENIKRLAKKTFIRRIVRSRRMKHRTEEAMSANFRKDRVVFVEHHTAHAAAAYYGLANYKDDILILTCDGYGDGLCATVNVGRGGKLQRLIEIPESESIGCIYSKVTFLLGMKPLEHEYKLMGMAPYAHARDVDRVYKKLRPLIDFDGQDGLTWSRRKNCPETYYSYSFFKDLLERQRFDWICGGLQKFTEEMLVTWVKNCIVHTGIHKLALSGGIFMNVKANKLIAELPEVEDLFVVPSSGDESNSIGAAYSIYSQETDDPRALEGIGPLYLGPSYVQDEIASALTSAKNRFTFTYKYYEDDRIEEKVASLLAEGQIVARFSGAVEFGARALGSRSILADPKFVGVIRIINEMIKNRDFWMPFAPSILQERADDYIVNPKCIKAPYMMMAFDTAQGVGDIIAAVHPYDFSVRPQLLTEDFNSSYYRLLKSFEQITARGAVLNTSFNLHGFPIVCSPEDAMHVFEISGLKYMALGNYLVQKE